LSRGRKEDRCRDDRFRRGSKAHRRGSNTYRRGAKPVVTAMKLMSAAAKLIVAAWKSKVAAKCLESRRESPLLPRQWVKSRRKYLASRQNGPSRGRKARQRTAQRRGKRRKACAAAEKALCQLMIQVIQPSSDVAVRP